VRRTRQRPATGLSQNGTTAEAAVILKGRFAWHALRRWRKVKLGALLASFLISVRGYVLFMKQLPADFFEWHIFQNTGPVTGSSAPPSMRMGPFATEKECRTVLETLKTVPTFRDTTLEVRRAVRSREKRVKIRLAVRVSPLARPDVCWEAPTVDISSRGARLANSGDFVKLGEFLDVRYGPRGHLSRGVDRPRGYAS